MNQQNIRLYRLESNYRRNIKNVRFNKEIHFFGICLPLHISIVHCFCLRHNNCMILSTFRPFHPFRYQFGMLRCECKFL